MTAVAASILVHSVHMSDKASSPHRCYCFGPFRLDTRHQQLYQDDRPLELPRRLVRTLQLLVENHGKDLEKTYLMEQLWPATVVEEKNLTIIISRLRKVLGDGVEHQKYILTNPGRGYRFVAEVMETVPDTRARQPLGWRVGLVALILLLALLAVYAWNKDRASQSIAVLPFQTLGAEPDDGYLGLGMADGLIARLRNIRDVVVQPTAAVAKYQGTARDPLALGKELHVVSLLNGSVQRTGHQVWLRVKLLRVKDGAVLWAHDYHGKFADILTLQDQIADQATRALALKLDGAEQQSIRRHYTDSSDAYQAYIGGRSYCRPAVPERLPERGISYFQQAIAQDPQFALAYAGLAACYAQLARASGKSSAAEFFRQAEWAARRALEIDGTLPEAYLPLAIAKAYYDWDFPAAETAFRRGIGLDPQDSAKHTEYTEFLISQGRFQEAEREANRAAELDPFSLEASWEISNIYFYGRRYREAAGRWEKDREFNLDEALWYLGWIYASQGRQIPLIDDVIKAQATAPKKAVFTAGVAYLYALQGMKPLAESYLRKLSQYPDEADDYQISLIYLALGDKDRAFQFLDRAREDRSADIIFVKVDPRLDSLRADPRFNDLVRSVHLNP